MKVAMMGISEREQQTLESIEGELAGAAPKLAAMLAIFSRLTADEKMPVREPVRRAVRSLSSGATAMGGHPGLAGRRHSWRWVWLVTAAALLAVALIMSRGTGSSACTSSPAIACRHAPAPIHPGLSRGGS